MPSSCQCLGDCRRVITPGRRLLDGTVGGHPFCSCSVEQEEWDKLTPGCPPRQRVDALSVEVEGIPSGYAIHATGVRPHYATGEALSKSRAGGANQGKVRYGTL